MRSPSVFFAFAALLAPVVLSGQILRDPPKPTAADSVPASAIPPADYAKQTQAAFERFRRTHMPVRGSGRPGVCDEPVGLFCYWYNEAEVIPPEPEATAAQRKRMLVVLDSLAKFVPADQWVSGQRVRYLVEDARPAEALEVARACPGKSWWCDVLIGFSAHALGEYASADSVFEVGIARMLPRDQCTWRDISMLLDDDAKQVYRRLPCGDPRRREYEDRAWFYARTLYLMHGNDSRTEYFSRMVMAQMMKDGGSGHAEAFGDEQRELMLRFGWETAWSREAVRQSPDGSGYNITGYEPRPAYRYIPAGFVLNNPAVSDSADWRLQLPPVMGRYAPPYAKVFRALEHQKAMFRRGDSALVVVAYDTREFPQFRGGTLAAALTVSPGDKPRAFQVRKSGGDGTGILTLKAPWAPLIMSTEVAAPDKYAVARARYGISPPYAIGTRVTVSDLLFFKPYGSFPSTADEAIPHALSTERVKAGDKLGVFWEAYGTDPQGEKMKISLTVVREVGEDPGFLRRRAQALRLVREVTPVSITVNDVSAFGKTISPRALELDISTLPKGSYIVQLELEAGGQYVVRADHRIEIISP
jgi:hypothetical protein